ncbi:hypothetical protein QRX60_38665 [Amycolatopsis mongoliensis]|uniref:AAA+ ATPase domain-containing protein n=1 Tax=Amycolatopsis mongoliensis TaxID=715475 RepID=A0A9Y2JME3_9PSEU|nr:hypothetical protein [Amycolatopsis sp. 4-36]WIX99936.1 hypothetical protein QRX60_38665 [Amycolatopsis sp. 4-36]
MRAEVVVGIAGAVIALVTAVVAVLLRRRKPPVPGTWTVFGDVPREPLSAVHRGSLRARIEEIFRSGRFCVLLGGSGAGKTHLAAAFARESRSPVVWVAAEDPANAVLAFAELAGAAGPDAETAARAGLAWLDGLGDAVVVFDGAIDPDALNRWLPARARVLVTTTVPDFEVLGGTVAVGGFDEADAVRFLGARAGRDPDEATVDVVRELGCLPLALAQAAAVIRRQGFASYLDRLPHTPPLEREPGEAHPACAEDTTLAALRMVAARDSRALVVAELLAVLASRGTRRALAHRAGPDPVAVDAALAGLAGASLAEFDVRGGVVVMHRLTQRAVLGRLHAEERLAPALDRAFDVVEAGDPTVDLVDHAAALWRHFRALPSGELGSRLGRILRLRRRSVDLLVEAGALARARTLGLEVLADHHAYLPAGHEDIALAARSLHRAGERVPRAG